MSRVRLGPSLHWVVLRALAHPGRVIRLAQWGCLHMRRAPKAIAEELGGAEPVALGMAERCPEPPS